MRVRLEAALDPRVAYIDIPDFECPPGAILVGERVYVRTTRADDDAIAYFEAVTYRHREPLFRRLRRLEGKGST